jgi:mercuric ion transport protein
VSTHRDHRPPADLPITATGRAPIERAPDDGGPPLRSKVTAALAVLACAACCALPLLIGAGLLTGAGAALAEQTLPAIAVLLIAVAAGMWWLHRRRAARTAAASGTACGCGGKGCGC